MNKQALRQHVINILDDEHGISAEAYHHLQQFVFDTAPGTCADIFNATEGVQGRVFLNENHGILA
jgi:hypothetical protein